MPYISEDTINRIRERLNIIEAVKDYVSLKKRGRNWIGLCPFHTEKTPSFNVSEEKSVYHCFGCNAGGNMFKFIMEIENVTFPESIEILAKKAGITVEYKQSVSDETGKERELIYKVNEKAAFIFHFYLKDRPEGEKAREYLKERNINPDMIELFKLGYAPDDYHKLHKELLKEHYKEATILKAGLMLKSKKGNNNYYDRFRNRLIFPITSGLDKVIGFGGRIMDSNASQPKYLNTQETQIFSKRKNLYGLNITRNHIRDKRQAIIVEGYFDLISLFQADIKNVAAPLGTALTNEQILLLKRYADEIVILFDSDAAGNSAAIRSISLLLSTNLKIRIVQLPSDMDPDEFVMKHGQEAILKLIQSAPSFLKFIIKDAFNKYDRTITEDKNKILQFIFPIIKQINNEILKSDVFRYLANELKIDEHILLNEFSKFSNTGASPILKTANKPKASPGSLVLAQRYIIMTLIENPEYIEHVLKKANINCFDDPLSSTIMKNIQELYQNNKQISLDILIDNIQDNKIKEFITKESLSEKYNHDVKKQLNDCIFKLRLHKIDEQIKIKNNKIKELKEFNEIKKAEKEIQNLIKEKNTLKQNKNYLMV